MNNTSWDKVIGLLIIVAALLIMVIVGAVGRKNDRKALCPIAYTTYESVEDFFRDHSMCRYMLDEEGS